MAEPAPLRLLAEDDADLRVMSAAVQDSVAKTGALKYNARRRRFSVEINRYRWETAEGERQRVRAILAFDGVLAVRARGITRDDPDLVISLLQATFTPGSEAPAGTVTLVFAGDGEIALDVEALDATLLDSDYVWPTRHEPSHERRRP